MKIPFLVVTLASALLALPCLANTVTLTGDNTGGAVFNRPTETGALSFQTVPYQAYIFSVSASGAYSFTLVASNPDVYDTYLHLYTGGFDPTMPMSNFLAANDDSAGGANAGSALTGVNLTAATTYYFIADGFTNLDYGAFTATLSGPGTITVSAVPEPSSFALAAFTLVGAIVWGKRRHRHAAKA